MVVSGIDCGSVLYSIGGRRCIVRAPNGSYKRGRESVHGPHHGHPPWSTVYSFIGTHSKYNAPFLRCLDP